MSEYRKFAQAIRALQLVQTGPSNDLVTPSRFAPHLPSEPDWCAPLPTDSLLFGLAADGKPLLLSLSNPQPGPILVIAERGSGKTHFLKMLLMASSRLKRPGEVQFAVLTSFPDDFAHLHAPEHLMGVWPAYDPSASEMILALSKQVQNQRNRQPVVLLVDGMDAIFQLEPEAQENLGYILESGCESQVWTVVTANADLIVGLPDWLDCFRTRIYGRVTNPQTAHALSPVYAAPLNSLLPGAQFCLREKSHWLKFWLPTVPV